MSVLNSDVLDGVAHNNGELVMLISDHLDWSNEGEHLLALQDKINAYNNRATCTAIISFNATLSIF